MKNRFPSILNLGLSSIITIFIVLTLSIFASLALLTARSDYGLSQKTADRVTQVYDARNQGEELLKDIDDMLIKSYNSMKEISYTEYCSTITDYLDTHDLADYTFVDDTLLLTSDLAVNDDQVLHTELIPVLPKREGDVYYTISQWKIQNTKSWEKDDSLQLLTPANVPDNN